MLNTCSIYECMCICVCMCACEVVKWRRLQCAFLMSMFFFPLAAWWSVCTLGNHIATTSGRSDTAYKMHHWDPQQCMELCNSSMKVSNVSWHNAFEPESLFDKSQNVCRQHSVLGTRRAIRSSQQLDRRLTRMIGSNGLTCANDDTNQTRQK